MASNINANNIDGTFPVAGVDNDSQGFRTNFTNVKNNFTYAKTEISDLQDKAILKSALTGGTLNNNMAGAVLSSAEIKDFRETRYDHVDTSGTITLNHSNAHYQSIGPTTGSVTLTFSNLPAAGKLGRIKLEITIASIAHTLTLPAAVTLGVTGIAGISSNVITFSETGTYIFEFTTDDAGTTIHIADQTRPRDYFFSDHIRLISRNITDPRGTTGDLAGMLAVDTTTPAIWLCTSNYSGGTSTVIWRKAELESNLNEIVLATDITTTSSSLGNLTGLTFLADSSTRYRFDAYIPFTHSASSTNTHTFSINFAGASVAYATIEQQAGPTTAPVIATISTADSTAGVATTSSTSVKMCRITGTFYAPAGPAAQRTLDIRFATNGGTLTAKAGSYIRFNKV
jgi:hypothetical protein